MLEHYILENGRIRQEHDLLTWARWMENRESRSIDRTMKKDMVVSTVFLGIDHDFSFVGAPLLFETMVFKRGKALDFQQRYTTLLEAKIGHKLICKKFLK